MRIQSLLTRIIHSYTILLDELCKMFLGEATIQYTFVGCAMDPVVLSEGQSDVRVSYSVPTHHIEVRVTRVAGHEGPQSATEEFENYPVW